MEQETPMITNYKYQKLLEVKRKKLCILILSMVIITIILIIFYIIIDIHSKWSPIFAGLIGNSIIAFFIVFYLERKVMEIEHESVEKVNELKINLLNFWTDRLKNGN